MAESREIQALREKVAKAQKHGLFIGVHNKNGKFTFSDLVPETIAKNLEAKANWVYLLNNRLAGDINAIRAYLSKIGLNPDAIDDVIITKDNLAENIDAINQIIAVYADKEAEYMVVAKFLQSIQSKGAGLNKKVTYSNKAKAVKSNKKYENIMMLYNNPTSGVNEKGERTVKIYVVGAKNALKPEVVRADAYLIPTHNGRYFPIGVPRSKKDGVTALTDVLNKIQKATGNNLSEFMNFAGLDVKTGLPTTGVSTVKTPVK